MPPKATTPAALRPTSSPNALAVHPLPAASLGADLHQMLVQVLTPANLAFLKIMVIGAGAVAGKKAVELFVEQATTWFSKKRSIEGFEISPPPGMTIDSLSMEGTKAVITLKVISPSLTRALAPVPNMPVAAPTQVPSLKKKRKK